MSAVRKIRADVSVTSLTDAELLAGIRARLRLAVEAIEDLAKFVREARRRNLSLAEFSTGMPARLLAVADGKLDAEILFKFAGERNLVDAIVGVPLKLQRDLAAGGTIGVVEQQHDGRYVTVQKTLRQMSGPQARQVFADGRYVDPDTQRANVKKLQASARVNATKRGANPAKVKIEADVATKTVVVGGFRLKPADFAGAFKALGFKIVREQ